MLNEFDVDKDGCFNWDEFCTLCQQNKMDDQQCKKWWHIFSRPFSKRYRFESCNEFIIYKLMPGRVSEANEHERKLVG